MTAANDSTDSQSKPLVVVCVEQSEGVGELAALGCDVQYKQSLVELTSGEFWRSPRLILIRPPEATRKRAAEVQSAIQALQRMRPLTDIVVWSPRASGASVRDWFLSGAKDVVVTESQDDLLGSLRPILASQKMLPRINELTRGRSRTSRFDKMLSRSRAMWDLFDIVEHVARADATVLIVGETGTGKELLARAIHRRSGRSGRFVPANCASISEELVNSELFGHEKGAFTGAERAKKGLVQHAQHGTIFLDEIGDMPVSTQQALLRMLQEKKTRTVGGLVEQDVDARVIAATNVPLDEAVRLGEFREDLFYRLDVIRLNVPALRERPEDILFLFGFFVKQYSKHYGLAPPLYSDSFMDAALAYPWPGNIRQLENFSERLVLSRPRRALAARDFAALSSDAQPQPAPTVPTSKPANPSWQIDLSRTLSENVDPFAQQIERAYLESLLSKHAGKIALAASAAGISRRTLLRKMKQFALNKNDYKQSGS